MQVKNRPRARHVRPSASACSFSPAIEPIDCLLLFCFLFLWFNCHYHCFLLFYGLTVVTALTRPGHSRKIACKWWKPKQVVFHHLFPFFLPLFTLLFFPHFLHYFDLYSYFLIHFIRNDSFFELGDFLFLISSQNTLSAYMVTSNTELNVPFFNGFVFCLRLSVFLPSESFFVIKSPKARVAHQAFGSRRHFF